MTDHTNEQSSSDLRAWTLHRDLSADSRLMTAPTTYQAINTARNAQGILGFWGSYGFMLVGLGAGAAGDGWIAALGGAGIVACIGGAVGLSRFIKRRERRYGTLTAGDLRAAPEELREQLLRARRAARRISRSTAYTERWLTDIDLDAALWDLVEHVKIGTALTTQLRDLADLDDQHHHAAEAAEARDALAAVTDHVHAGAHRLTGLAHSVAELDDQLAEPARRAELETARQHRVSAAARHADRLGEIRSALDRIDPAVDAAADTLAGQLDAYTQIPAFPVPAEAGVHQGR